jgi:hypothetical protein
MDTTRYVSVTFKKGLLIEGGLHPQCSQGEALSQVEYVKYSDVEKAVKLFQRLKPLGKPCNRCQHYVGHNETCGLFMMPIMDFLQCDDCKEIFGGE